MELKFEFWREKYYNRKEHERQKIIVVWGSNFDGRDQSDEH